MCFRETINGFLSKPPLSSALSEEAAALSLKITCGFSSSGRASPSQGECGGFESRNPLQVLQKKRGALRAPRLF